MVFIKFFGYLSNYREGKDMDAYDFANGVSIKEVLNRLHIPDSAVGCVSVNGSMVDMSYQIVQEDQVKIFPVIMGG